MGRWIDIIREREPRDWMVPGVGPDDPPGGSDTPGGVATRAPQRTYRTPWARGPRAPLRRNQGVPAPLETPVYLHLRELRRARKDRPVQLGALVGWTVAAVTLVVILSRLFLPL